MNKNMNRREILRYTAWLTGTAVAAPLASAVLTGCSDAPSDAAAPAGNPSDGQVLHFFSPDAFHLVTEVADTLLPRTDSPSASDVGVPQTLDSMLGVVLERSYVEQFQRLWSDLETTLKQDNFVGQDGAGREALLSQLETTQEPTLASARDAMVMLKQQVVIYYLTTETIGEQYLNYLPIPGEYKPCISVDDVDNKKWAI